MALNIKDERIHEKVKRIAALTGQTQSRAVEIAVTELLARLEQRDKSARILEIGRRAASMMSPQLRALDHGELLYDENGIPK